MRDVAFSPAVCDSAVCDSRLCAFRRSAMSASERGCVVSSSTEHGVAIVISGGSTVALTTSPCDHGADVGSRGARHEPPRRPAGRDARRGAARDRPRGERGRHPPRGEQGSRSPGPRIPVLVSRVLAASPRPLRGDDPRGLRGRAGHHERSVLDAQHLQHAPHRPADPHVVRRVERRRDSLEPTPRNANANPWTHVREKKQTQTHVGAHLKTHPSSAFVRVAGSRTPLARSCTRSPLCATRT